MWKGTQAKIDQPIAAFIGDIHFSDVRPACRAEEDWIGAQIRTMEALSETLWRVNPTKLIPLFIAGDLFHKWNSSPELVNAVMDNFPRAYVIPGQHDIPYHDKKLIHKSSYYTATHGSHPLINLESSLLTGNLKVHPFPWGFTDEDIEKAKNHIECNPDLTHIALAHMYCWEGENSYPGAPPANHVMKVAERFADFDGVVTGDNHLGFTWRSEGHKQFAQKPIVFVHNCGKFLTRSHPETYRNTVIGFLMSGGGFKTEVFGEPRIFRIDEKRTTEVENDQLELDQFIAALLNSRIKINDVRSTIKKYIDINKLGQDVAQAVLQMLEAEDK